MNLFVKIVVIFAVIKSVCLYPYPKLVRVRKLEDANGAEYVALDSVGLIEQMGYPAEEHNLTTKDGYILNVFRIPWSPKLNNENKKKPVVLLQTGLFGSSDVWVLFGANNSLGLALADAGYDVWLGNFRGNTYGRAHVSISPENSKFWEFSYHEIGIFDLPTMIDHILNVTNQSSMIYTGHSMGITSLMVLLSQQPEYNQKLDLIICMALSAGFPGNSVTQLLRQISLFMWQEILGTHAAMEAFPQSSNFAGFVKRTCIEKNTMNLCDIIFEMVLGETSQAFSNEYLVKNLCYIPAGISTRIVWHYYQMGNARGKFLQYDWGKEENLRLYGQTEPPEYNLKNVRSPMLIFYGKNDKVSTREMALSLMSKVSSKAILEPIRSNLFGHFSFIISHHVKELVNDRIIERLTEFNNTQIPYFQ